MRIALFEAGQSLYCSKRTPSANAMITATCAIGRTLRHGVARVSSLRIIPFRMLRRRMRFLPLTTCGTRSVISVRNVNDSFLELLGSIAIFP